MKLVELLKDFNPVFAEDGADFSLVSDILVLSKLKYRFDDILFGYIENINGLHTWIKMPYHIGNLEKIEGIVESQVALRIMA